MSICFLLKAFETIGPVSHPMYVVRFNDPSEINKVKVITNAKVFSVDELSHFVFTRDISEHKGCDASNLYDEEVNEEVGITVNHYFSSQNTMVMRVQTNTTLN